jgi:hypothetical protein
MEDEAEPKSRTFKETIEVTGSQVIEQVKRLIREGNVRHLKVSAKDSDFSLEMPVTVGVLVGGAVVLTAPWLALLGVVAGLVTKVEIEVERDAPPLDQPEAAPVKADVT